LIRLVFLKEDWMCLDREYLDLYLDWVYLGWVHYDWMYLDPAYLVRYQHFGNQQE